MENKLGYEPISRLLFKMAVPTVLAQLVNLLYNIIDRIYVGRIPETGSLSLAGLGVTFPIIMLISAFAMLAGMGASRAAIAMGKGDNESAEQYLGNSTALLIIFAVLLGSIFFIARDKLLLLFGASENTLPYASSYISIYLIGTIFVQIALGLNMFITNQGFTKISMITICIGAVLNIILDPVFIYAFGMGVNGAALATIISQAVSAIWVIKFLTGKKTILKIRLKNLRLRKKTVVSIISLGISPFIMQATECLIQLTFNNGMLKYGNDLYVALMSVLFSLMQLIWLPLSGFSQGAQPIIGYNYGAKKFDRVKSAFTLQFKISLGFSLLTTLAVILFPKVFVGMFTNDPELLNIGINTTRLFLAGMTLMGAQSACQQTFLALGEAKISLFLACLRKIILLIPLALILPKINNLGVWGLLLAEAVSDVLAASTTTIMFYFKSKKLFK
ncbi:MAG: MATE family efflux transporter [Clostridia bacterium]|nr:MATE family efflux transporter [Clostridia bacterium]